MQQNTLTPFKMSMHGQIINRHVRIQSYDDQLIERLYNFLLYTKIEFTPANLIVIVTNLMSIVGKYKKLSGGDKKDLVLAIMNKYIDDMEIPDDKKTALKFVLENVVPGTIDVIIDVSKKRINFKKGIIATILQKCCFS